MSNYLELVNLAILESGVDLDDLTSATFASPAPSKMYKKMKRWVAKAWEDIQLEDNEWEFMTDTASITIYPRIRVDTGLRATAPPAGAVYAASTSDTGFTIVSTVLNSGTWAAGTADAILNISNITGSSGYILKESYREVSPTPANNIFKMKYFGRYNLKDFVANLEAAEYKSFSIQNQQGGFNKLLFVPWAQWVDEFEFQNAAIGQPVFFTETPEGYLDFYPRPDTSYTLTFPYTKGFTALTLYSDSPSELPARYHEAIVWKAVMYYANYDKNTKLWSDAAARYFALTNAMDRDLKPKPFFGRSLYG